MHKDTVGFESKFHTFLHGKIVGHFKSACFIGHMCWQVAGRWR